jgi:hypothetical protein
MLIYKMAPTYPIASVVGDFEFDPPQSFDGLDECPSATITLDTGNDAAKIKNIKVTVTKLTHSYGKDMNLIIKKDGLVVVLIGKNGAGNQAVDNPGNPNVGPGGAYPSELPAGKVQFENLVFDDEATLLSSQIAAGPFANSGPYKPWQALSALDNLCVDGDYTLEVCDSYGIMSGTIHGYILEVEYEDVPYILRPETTVKQNGETISILDLYAYRALNTVQISAKTQVLNEAQFRVNGNVDLRDQGDINGKLKAVENSKNIVQFSIDKKTFLDRLLYKRDYNIYPPTGDESGDAGPFDATSPFKEIAFYEADCKYEHIMMETVSEEISLKLVDMIALEPENSVADADLKTLHYTYEDTASPGDYGLYGLPSTDALLVSKHKVHPTSKAAIAAAWDTLYETEKQVVKNAGGDLGDNQVFDTKSKQMGLLGRQNEMSFTVTVHDGRILPAALGGGKTSKNMYWKVEPTNSGKVAISNQHFDGAWQGMAIRADAEMNQNTAFDGSFSGNDGKIFRQDSTGKWVKSVGHGKTAMPDASKLQLTNDVLHTASNRFETLRGTTCWVIEPRVVVAKINPAAVASFVQENTNMPLENLNKGLGFKNNLDAIKEELSGKMGADKEVRGFYSAPSQRTTITTTLPYMGANAKSALMGSTKKEVDVVSKQFTTLLAIKAVCQCPPEGASPAE